MFFWNGNPAQCPCCGNEKDVKEPFCARCQETEHEVKEAMRRLQRDVFIDERGQIVIISAHA